MSPGTFRLFLIASVMAVVLAAPVWGEDASNRGATRDEINALRQRVLEPRKRIQHLVVEQTKPQKGVSDRLPCSEIEKTATAQTRQPGEESQGIGTQPPAPLELGGHAVRVGIAGAVQADVIHDFNALGLNSGDGVAREFITANIPVGGSAADVTNRTAFSPNQSYLIGWAETDTPWGPFNAYANVNLFGSTTEAEFQIYRAYARWGWLMAGLDYSLWANQAAIPSTLDFEGPNSVPENIFTQASLKIPLRPGAEKCDFFFTVGVEDVGGELTLPSGIANISTVNQVPSVIGKISYETGSTQIELAGLYRRLKAEGNGYDQSVDGWGVSFSASVDTWRSDNFVWGIEYGEALGAYIQDTTGLGLDAAPVSATNSDLKAIPAFGLWVGYQHWWNKFLRSSGTYGFVNLDSDFDMFPQPAGTGTYKRTHYASLNLVWSPWHPFDVGLEYLYGHRTVTDATAVDDSTTGYDHRLQFTMRWNFGWERVLR